MYKIKIEIYEENERVLGITLNYDTYEQARKVWGEIVDSIVPPKKFTPADMAEEILADKPAMGKFGEDRRDGLD